MHIFALPELCLFEDFALPANQLFFIGEMLLQKLHFWTHGFSCFALLPVSCDDSIISVNEAGTKERNFAHLLPPILQDAWNKFTSEER